LAARIADEPTVLQAQDAIRFRRYVHVMRDDDDRLMVLIHGELEQFQYFPSVRAVQVTRRFIREHDGRTVSKRSADRDSLLLTAGQLGW
jgi:hypothetical protein